MLLVLHSISALIVNCSFAWGAFSSLWTWSSSWQAYTSGCSRVRTSQVQSPPLPVTSCMTLGKSLSSAHGCNGTKQMCSADLVQSRQSLYHACGLMCPHHSKGSARHIFQRLCSGCSRSCSEGRRPQADPSLLYLSAQEVGHASIRSLVLSCREGPDLPRDFTRPKSLSDGGFNPGEASVRPSQGLVLTLKNSFCVKALSSREAGSRN